MKKWWLLMLLIPAMGMAQTKREIYIKTYAEIAMREMRLYGIPASITLAQGILESGDGQSKLATKANNHFGIKCHSDWKGPSVRHHDDKRNECFRKYKHAEESFRDHSEFLAHRQRYAFLFELDRTDYKAWANGLKKAGYATSNTYAKLLIRIIEENQLHQYDVEALGKQILPEERILEAPNGAKYVLLEEGETIEDLAELYKKSVHKLLDFNDMTHEATLATEQRIYVKRKKCRGSQKWYKVQPGETMHSISQTTGVRLKYLYKRNLKPVGWQPSSGESIRLRGKVKK